LIHGKLIFIGAIGILMQDNLQLIRFIIKIWLALTAKHSSRYYRPKYINYKPENNNSNDSISLYGKLLTKSRTTNKIIGKLNIKKN
jgi:sortase (surface protein transpeptidase)